MKSKTLLMVCIIVCAACKTRKVQTDITSTSKSTDTEQTSHIHSRDSVATVDKSTSQSNSLKTAENTASGEIDSIVTNGKKTVIYPTKGKPFNYTGKTSRSSTKTKQKDVTTTGTKSLDSAGTFKQTTKQDSTHKAKITDAKGSGTTWATYVGAGVGLGILLLIYLIYRYFKNKQL